MLNHKKINDGRRSEKRTEWEWRLIPLFRCTLGFARPHGGNSSYRTPSLHAGAPICNAYLVFSRRSSPGWSQFPCIISPRTASVTWSSIYTPPLSAEGLSMAPSPAPTPIQFAPQCPASSPGTSLEWASLQKSQPSLSQNHSKTGDDIRSLWFSLPITQQCGPAVLQITHPRPPILMQSNTIPTSDLSLSSLPGENKYRKDQNPCSFKSSSLQTDAKEYYFCLFASQENNRDRRVLEHCGRERERSEKAKQSKAEQRSRERGTERERDRRGSYIANFGVFCNFVSPPHLHSLSFFSLFFFSFFEYRL